MRGLAGAARPWGPIGAIAAVGLLVVAVGSGSGGEWTVAAGGREQEAGPAAGQATTVVRVIDGDTLVVAADERVRLIGVDAPEADQCYGAEATSRLRELLPDGAAVRLEYDEERRDASGRTLAYVRRAEDGLFVNQALARDGFVREMVTVPNLAHVDDILIAIAQAQAAGKGLWTACASAPAPATTVRPNPPVSAASNTTSPSTTS